MRYVGGERVESGCIFCNRLASVDDRRSLILHREHNAFAIMNLYPYNTGHTMLVPREHVASPEDADPGGIEAMARLRRPLLRALRRALNCDGFNLGMNVGAVAGAGVADHLHEHVVPRWTGDANFMPILANTMVLPELLSVTYAKLRAELVRQQSGTAEAQCVLFASQRQSTLLDDQGFAPRVVLPAGVPVWRVATEAMRTISGTQLELTGWAGAEPAGSTAITLTLDVDPQSGPTVAPQPGWNWVSIPDIAASTTATLIATSLQELPQTTPTPS